MILVRLTAFVLAVFLTLLINANIINAQDAFTPSQVNNLPQSLPDVTQGYSWWWLVPLAVLPFFLLKKK